jgi:acetyltransferase-like isoleucine patch superfamily enzyme
MGTSEVFNNKDKIIENKIMEHKNSIVYQQNIQNRSLLHFIKGLVPRYLLWRKHEKARLIARKRGATIGENAVVPLSLAMRANKNLIVGHNASIQTDKIDLRSPVKIGNYCIIGICEIITTSHQVDSPDWEHKNYGIEIDDYAWVATNVLVTPACRHIGYGAVAGAGSVVVKNVEPMSIIGGNPAVHLRYRKQVHDRLVVESLLGGDLKAYIATWKNRKKN